jgi:transposase
MARFYVGPQREQLLLMPVSMRDWLEEGHLAWFVIDVVEQLDTAALHVRHRNDGPGRPAYDPDMMLALLLYAYANGVRSSRRIEAACRTDAAYRVISGGLVPDHATLARFVVDHQEAMQALFVSGLRLCAAAGLVDLATVAIDGTKIGADAALDANRSAEWIRLQVQRLLAEAVAADAADAHSPALLPPDRPEELASPAGRLGRLQAALARIEAEDRAAHAHATARQQAARRAAEAGHKLHGPKPTDPHAALARAQADHAAVLVAAQAKHAARAAKIAAAAAEGRRLPGRKPAADHAVERAAAALAAAKATAEAAAQAHPPRDRSANITDPDSRIMNSSSGWVQGYNAQAAVNSQQIVLAGMISQNGNDVELYQPMTSALADTLSAAGVTEPVGLILADAGYWSHANAIAPGPDRLIATLKDWKQRRAAREAGTTNTEPPEGACPMNLMEHRLRTVEGARAYATRSHTVEPVFGHHKHNRGWRQFRRRGLSAVRSEWALMNLSHNITKLYEHGIPRPATI